MPRNHPRHRARFRRRSTAAWAVGALAATGLLSAEALDHGPDPVESGLPTSADVTVENPTTVSRDAERPPLTEAIESAVSDAAEQRAAEEKEAEAQRRIDAAIADPKSAAREMMGEFGFGADQFGCLDRLWQGESNWDHTATNPTSGAYGIPQSLPATKMATAGDDWETNPLTQIRWGLGYIRDAYGTPCSADAFKSGRGWY